MGYYAEMKDPKNADKTMQELKDIVFKNLTKDPIHYTKDGQFGVKGLGYTMDAPGLGEPKEAKGKYKSSGYGDLKEGVEKFVSDVKDAVTKKGDKKFSPEEIKAKLKQKREAELKRRKEAGESLEEITLREVVQNMIFEELNSEEFEDTLFKLEQPHLSDKASLTKIQKIYARHSAGLNSISQNIEENEVEEAYQLVNINPIKSDKERGEREPQPFKMSYVDPSIIDSLTKNQHLRILRNPSNPENITLAIRARFVPTSAKNVGKTTDNLDKLPLDIPSDFKNFLTDANNISGEKQLPTREGVAELYKVLNNATLNKNGSLVLKVPNPNYQKTQESLQESVEKDLADINKEAEHEVLQTKLDKIDDLIDHRRSKLSKLDEDEDMKALTDKKKVKELEKDIKKLEVARKKVEKMMSKFKGKKSESKDVIDEVEGDEELPLETPLEASEEYLQYKEDAENRYDAGESIDSILDNYNNISLDMKNDLRNDLEGKMNGMDY
jgi:hypothetical protein